MKNKYIKLSLLILLLSAFILVQSNFANLRPGNQTITGLISDVLDCIKTQDNNMLSLLYIPNTTLGEYNPSIDKVSSLFTDSKLDEISISYREYQQEIEILYYDFNGNKISQEQWYRQDNILRQKYAKEFGFDKICQNYFTSGMQKTKNDVDMFYETQDLIVQKAYSANTKPKQVVETRYEIQITEGNKVAVFTAVKKDNNFYIIESINPSYNNSEY